MTIRCQVVFRDSARDLYPTCTARMGPIVSKTRSQLFRAGYKIVESGGIDRNQVTNGASDV